MLGVPQTGLPSREGHLAQISLTPMVVAVSQPSAVTMVKRGGVSVPYPWQKKKKKTQAGWERAASPWLLSPVCWAAQGLLPFRTAQPKGLGLVDILARAVGCLGLCMPGPAGRHFVDFGDRLASHLLYGRWGRHLARGCRLQVTVSYTNWVAGDSSLAVSQMYQRALKLVVSRPVVCGSFCSLGPGGGVRAPSPLRGPQASARSEAR